MKKIYWLSLLLLNAYLLDAQSYRKLHFRSTVVDTHNDILTTAISKGYSFDQDLTGKTHSDLARMLAGGIDVQFFSVWCDGSYGPGKAFAHANRQIDTLLATIQRNPSKIALTTSPSQLKANLRKGKISALIGVEGGHMIEDNLDYLDSLYRRGVRYMTLTWNNSTSWATSAMLESSKGDSLKQKGLTEFGKQVVRRMNELGMIVDVSHVGEQTFWDAINTSTKPVIASHSCAHAICPVFRNLKDDQVKAIARNGGVIHLNFFSGFVDSSFMRRNQEFMEKHKAERDSLLKTVTDPYFAEDYLFQKYAAEVKALRPPLSMLLDHLDYIVKLVGVDHVGLGSDFDGISSAPQQLDDVTAFPVITEELIKRGYSKKDIRKILGENFIRVWKAQR
jgi:Zn-dependent dipeptidase, microsomal dipeptidase homolog